MASRTQLRLQQITGSIQDLKSEVTQYLTPANAVNLTGSDLQDILGVMGAAIQRIHGNASDEVFGQTEGKFDTTNFDVNTTVFTVDSTNTFSIDGVGGSNVTTNGALTVSGSTGVSIASHSGEIDLTSTRGKIDINASAAAVDITGTTLDIDASAGAFNIAGTAASTVTTSGGALNLDGQTGVNIQENGTTIIGIDDDRDVDYQNVRNYVLTGSGTATLDAGGVINIGTTNSNSTISIGTSGARAINIGSANADVTITSDNNTTNFVGAVAMGGDLTVTGDLVIKGSTTTVSSSNTVLQDSIIGLGVSGSANDADDINNLGDRGIIFARAAKSTDALPGFWWDGTNFTLAKSPTSPTSQSFGTVAAADYSTLEVGDVDPGTSNTYALGSTSLQWSDIFLGNGAVINFNNGNVALTHSANQLLLASGKSFAFGDAGESIIGDGTNMAISASADFKIDAGGKITLDADGKDIFIEDGGARRGKITHVNNGVLDFLVLSSSAAHDLAFMSNGASILFADGDGANALTFIMNENNVAKILDSEDRERIRIETAAGGDKVQISGSLVIDGGAAQAGIRFQELDANGTGEVLLRGPQAVASNNTITFTLPSADGTAGQFLKTDSNGNLSFDDASGSTSKGIYVMTASLSAGSAYNLLDSSDRDIESDAISSLGVSPTQSKTLDVFVNGQLLVSGSAAERGANPPTRDYEINSTTTLKFAFDLEIDDIIQVIKR